MSNQNPRHLRRSLAVAAAITALTVLGVAPAIQAETGGMERRDNRQDDRQGDRGNRQDTRDECSDTEGAGKDKRDCKQEGRQENAGNEGNESPET